MLTKMTADQCVRCHAVEPVFSHPTGMRPSKNLPAHFPLDNGQVTCITCHLDSAEDHAQARAGLTTGTKLLRGTGAGSTFCSECHNSSALTRQAQHPTALSKAHLQWPPKSLSRNQTKTPSTRFAISDDGTRSCLGCHDGSIASDAYGGGTNFGVAASGNYSRQGHPIAVAYNSPIAGKTLNNPDRGMVPVQALDFRIRLFNGQVGCSSCHSLYSRQNQLLTKSNRNSELCLSCHAMR